MKNHYLAVMVRQDGKNLAYVKKVGAGDNLVCTMKGLKGATAANLCETKKKAEETVELWNRSFKENKTYMFA